MPASASTSTSPPGPATFFSVCVAEILFLVAALSEWSRRTWILRQKWPPSSRRRPPRSSSTSTHPNPRRASTTSPSTRWTPRRCRRAASPLPGAYKPCLPDAPIPPPALLSSAPLTSEATLHRRGRAPPRRGTKVILTDLRKHDDLNGEVGFIVFKPDDRFDGPSGTASSCATTRTSSSPRDQTCSSTRTHLAPRAASPARPPLSNSSLRPPRRPRRTVDDHPIQSLLDCFKQKLGLTASMCHSVLAQALSESMIQPARCALARPALARAPPLTACPSAQVNPPAGSDGDITFRLSLLASLSKVCLEDPRGQLVARLARASRSRARPRSQRVRLPQPRTPPLRAPHREPSAQIWDAASFEHESDSAVVELAKIPDEQALVRPNSNAAVVVALPLSFGRTSFRSRSSARSAFSWTRAFSRGRTSSRFGRATQLPARAVRAPHQLVAM